MKGSGGTKFMFHIGKIDQRRVPAESLGHVDQAKTFAASMQVQYVADKLQEATRLGSVIRGVVTGDENIVMRELTGCSFVEVATKEGFDVTPKGGCQSFMTEGRQPRI